MALYPINVQGYLQTNHYSPTSSEVGLRSYHRKGESFYEVRQPMRLLSSKSLFTQKLFPFKGSTLLRRSVTGLILAMFVLLMATSTAKGATIIYVDASAIGADTGLNWADAFPSLQDALAAAVDGDQIWVAAGVYYPDEGVGMTNDDRLATFALFNGLAVYGGFAGGETSLSQRDWETNVTVLSGDIEQNDTTDPNGVVTDVANIAGSNAYHVVTGGGTDSSAVLDGFTITAGQANGSGWPDGNGGGMFNNNSSPALTNVSFSGNQSGNDGGGIANYNSNPILTNLIFTSNVATYGGGMSNYYSSPTLTDVSFSGNQANSGGGMSNNNSNPILTNVNFSGNQATYGGGMINGNSSPTLTDGRFTGNQATSLGGGMYNSSSSPTLTNVSFSGNQANDGGGMHNNTSSPTLTNVSFSGNQANNLGGGMVNSDSSSPTLTNVSFTGNQADFGGGMFNGASNPTLTNLSLSGNQASTRGGGMYNGFSSPTLTNTILWNNQAGSSGYQIYNNSSNPVIAYSDIQGSGGSTSWDTALGTDGGNNIDADPLFVTPVDPATAPTTAGDLHLQYGSQAVDAGDNGVCPATDLDGNLRPIDGDLDGSAVCDMGAYEKLISLFLPLILR